MAEDPADPAVGAIVVIVPTKKEFEALLAECWVRGFGCETATLGRLSACWVVELGAYAACGGLGKAEFGIRT